MAVVQHDPQRWDAAAALVGSWPAAVVTSVVNEVAAEASYRRGDSIRILKRGALLHTDIALMGRYMGTTTPAGGSGVTVALVNDGRFAGYDFGLHWALARRLLDSVPRRDPMVHQWYVATTACMESQLQWGQATYQFQRARIIFPSDPAIFFYMGAMHEVFASPAIQSARGGAVGSVGTELGLARQFYQRVLKLNPDFSEGRLHLGRVTGLLGRHDEAIVELEGAAAVLKDPQLLYYAALFLGREQENLAQADAARKQFERAAQLYPAAQSPLFALSFLARSRGDSTGALNTVERALTLKVNDPLGEDPWWTYNVAHVRNADALMADMRKAFGGLPR
jgi:tetratricopeptide (TPR) repeat protein